VVASIRDLQDDANLVLATQAGDPEAFAELFRRHYVAVRAVCGRRLGSVVDADEVAQAAFVKALERIDQCGGEHRFGPWVQVIAARLCIDLIRARSRTTPEEDPLEGRNERATVGLPEEALLAAEDRREVHQALAALPSRQREVVIARHLEGRRPPEIAAALGLSLGAVDSLLLRARRRLAISVHTVSNDVGGANLSTLSGAAAAGLTATAVVTDNPLSRAASAIGQTLQRAAAAVATAVPRVPGLAGASDKIAASAVAGVVALGLAAGPAAPPRSTPPSGSTWPAAPSPVAEPAAAEPALAPVKQAAAAAPAAVTSTAEAAGLQSPPAAPALAAGLSRAGAAPVAPAPIADRSSALLPVDPIQTVEGVTAAARHLLEG
jgi:RNA polymerase sigma factor (sigma-70 family)